MLAAGGVAFCIVAAFFVYRHFRPSCDGLYDQTATKLDAHVKSLKGADASLVLGDEKVQDLTEGAQKLAICLKGCCVAASMGQGNMNDCMKDVRKYDEDLARISKGVADAAAVIKSGDAKAGEESRRMALALADTAIERAEAAGNGASRQEIADNTGIKGLPGPPIVRKSYNNLDEGHGGSVDSSPLDDVTVHPPKIVFGSGLERSVLRYVDVDRVRSAKVGDQYTVDWNDSFFADVTGDDACAGLGHIAHSWRCIEADTDVYYIDIDEDARDGREFGHFIRGDCGHIMGNETAAPGRRVLVQRVRVRCKRVK